MTAHRCRTHDPSCYRCDLSREEERTNLTDQVAALEAAEAAIRALHQPMAYDDAPDVQHCAHCQAAGDPFAPTGRTWPCPTITALDRA